MNRYLYILLLLLVFVASSFAQKSTLSGFVKDAQTGESLIGANVYSSPSLSGTTTNIYGFYSLTLPSDSITLIVSYVGYQTFKQTLALKGNQTLSIELSAVVDLKQVEISADKGISETSRMSLMQVPIEQIKSMPALFGEVDVLKAIQLLPGVHSGGEGSTGIYVRGGGPDQNLILLDGVPVYNASHLFGFFSVFNADAIRSVDLIKGGFPARYGGRLSSVIDIAMKEGNNKKLHGEGSLGIIASRFTLEGPIGDEKTSFIVSARRTYIDALAQPFILAQTGGQSTGGYYFYDLNAKINHTFSEKDRLYFSIYAGNDKFYFKGKDSYTYSGTTYTSKQKFGLQWGNITSALRWNHVINQKLFTNTTLTYSRYKFDVSIEQENKGLTTETFALNYFSGINDLNLKSDFDYIPSPNHYIRFGGNAIYHTFNPGAVATKYTSTGVAPLDTTMGDAHLQAVDAFLYAEDDMRIGDLLKLNVGLHASAFATSDTLYPSLQPRVSANMLLGDYWALKASYSMMSQYVHLLTNTGVGLPTDLWVPSSKKILPERSEQVAVGLARELFGEQAEFSVEGYYKTMHNILEYKEGSSFIDVGSASATGSSNWEDKVERGKGWAYGGEVFLQKKKGKTRGWIGYTLSWSTRQFDNINLGRIYPYKYDRRHDVAVVITRELSKHIDCSINWVYGSGNAITLPSSRYDGVFPQVSNYGPFPPIGEVYYYDSKNSFRMRANHRLDVGVTIHQPVRWGEITWNFGLYNAYSRQNPYFVYFGYNKSGNRVLKQVSLFPVLPYFSMNFKF